MKHFPGKRFLIFLVFFINDLSIAATNYSKLTKARRYYRRTKFIDNFIGLAELPNVHSTDKLQKRTSIEDGGIFVPHKSTTIVYKSRLVPVTYGFVIKKETLQENPSLLKLGLKFMVKKGNGGNWDDLKPKSICTEGSKVLLKLLNNLSKDILKIKKKLLPEEERHESGHKGRMEEQLNKNNKSTKKPKRIGISNSNPDFTTVWSRYLYCKRHSKKCSLVGLKKRWNKSGTHQISSKRKNRRKLRLRKGKKHCVRCKAVKKNRHSRNNHHQRMAKHSRHAYQRGNSREV